MNNNNQFEKDIDVITNSIFKTLKYIKINKKVKSISLIDIQLIKHNCNDEAIIQILIEKCIC